MNNLNSSLPGGTKQYFAPFFKDSQQEALLAK
jgi:hypothetical protein